MHTTPLRRRGVVSIGLQSTRYHVCCLSSLASRFMSVVCLSEESGTNTGHSPLMSRNRRRDHSALMRLAAMRGRGHQRHSHFSPGMMLMAMTVELGYEVCMYVHNTKCDQLHCGTLLPVSITSPLTSCVCYFTPHFLCLLLHPSLPVSATSPLTSCVCHFTPHFLCLDFSIYWSLLSC